VITGAFYYGKRDSYSTHIVASTYRNRASITLVETSIVLIFCIPEYLHRSLKVLLFGAQR
jgi:hypothetical protein